MTEAGRQEALAAVEAATGWRFRNPGLLEAALLHRSAAVEAGMGAWAESERLEFLGDAVVGLLTAERLFRDAGRLREGEMTRLRSGLTDRTALAGLARRLGIGAALRLGKGVATDDPHTMDNLLADAVESVFGAIWTDGGAEAAEAAYERCFGEEVRRALADGGREHPKSRLQQAVQGRWKTTPVYVTVAVEGPAHRPTYRAKARVATAEGEVLEAEGTGDGKQVAEGAAAAAWMERFGERLGEGDFCHPHGPPPCSQDKPLHTP